MNTPSMPARSIATVLEAIDHLDHPCALEIHKWIAAKRPARRVGVTTVYRALKRLVQDGTIRPLSFFEGEIRYDRNDKHQHFVCTNCKDIQVIDESGFKVELPRGDFELLFFNFDLFGYCARCQQARREASDQAQLASV